jgi:hypothetical protein
MYIYDDLSISGTRKRKAQSFDHFPLKIQEMKKPWNTGTKAFETIVLDRKRKP